MQDKSTVADDVLEVNKSKTVRLKAWCIYPERAKPEWFHCVMILENGWCPFGHLCSHPNYAPGDLWFGRPERQEIFKKMNIEIDMQPIVSQEHLEKLHPDIFLKNKVELNWKSLNDEYELIEKQIKAESK